MYIMIKKFLTKHSYLLGVIVLSMLPLLSLFITDKLVHTHDGLVHLPRMAAYYKALLDGQIPPRFAGDLNYGYGMPLFIFIYQFPYIVSSLLIALGSSLVGAFKVTLSLSYIFSGIFMWLFAREFFKSDKKALLVTVFYQFNTFRFVELLVRGSFGEVYTYTFLPLVLYGLVRLFKKINFTNIVLTSVAVALLIISHNSVSLLFFGVAVLFLILFGKNKRNITWGAASLLLGMGLSAYYWVSAMAEHKYTYGDLFMQSIYLEHFPPFLQLLVPNLTNIQFLQTGGIVTQLGLMQLVVLFVAFGVAYSALKKGKKLSRVIVFGFLIVFGALFFMQPVSKPLWERISLLRQFQFPWRFLSLMTFAIAMMAPVLLKFSVVKNKAVYTSIILLTIVTSVYYWLPSLGLDTIKEEGYWNFPKTTTYWGETDVIWSEGPASSYPASPVEIVAGDASVSNYVKKSNVHTYVVEVSQESMLVDHTQYFPGWRVLVDGKKRDIEFQDFSWKGQITYSVPEGKHKVEVRFGESKVRYIADMITVLSFVVIIIVGIFRKKVFKWFAKK